MRWWTGVVAAVVAAGCFREVIRTFEIRVPQMRTPQAAQMIEQALRVFDTNILIRVETDLSNRVVRVTYNSERAARRNFERAIVVLGFDANDLPGDPGRKSQLPEELR
ncbi:MAG: hypothetical protein N2652_08180 [Kiritimatiellae bacterium]|nr:hypothetical protein [Kiritimatiellia bacterium]